MAEFPLEPQLSKILIASVEMGCAEESLTVVAMLSVEEIFYRPKEKQVPVIARSLVRVRETHDNDLQAMADMKRARFFQPEGDHLTLLNVYQQWANSKFSNPWCHDNFLQSRALRRCQDVRKQLVSIMDRYRLPIEVQYKSPTSRDSTSVLTSWQSCGRQWNRVRRAITSGYFTNAAKKDPQEGYRTLVEGQPVYIHPSSSLFNRQPDWLIYHRLVLTSKEYLRECLAIDPKWLVELAPNVCPQHVCQCGSF